MSVFQIPGGGTLATTGIPLFAPVLSGAAPTAPLEGQYWYDPVTHVFSFRDNTKTVILGQSTTVTGLLKGSGGLIVAATAGTDYVGPTSQYPNLAFATLFSQTTTGSVVSFTYGVSQGTFVLHPWLDIKTVSTDVLNLVLTYKDQNGNSQTVVLCPQGSTSPNCGSVGSYLFPAVTIRAQGGTAIALQTVLQTSGGSINFDVGGTIALLQ